MIDLQFNVIYNKLVNRNDVFSEWKENSTPGKNAWTSVKSRWVNIFYISFFLTISHIRIKKQRSAQL